MPTPTVYAVVPAAGRSSRMGTQKLLLPFAATTVIGHVIASLTAAPLAGVIAVVSARGAAVADEASRAGATVVVNGDPDADMLSSVRTGLRSLPADADAMLVAPADHPHVPPQLVGELIDAFKKGVRSLVVPTCSGKRAHPLLVGSEWFEEVLTRYDGIGLRGLLAVHADHVVEIPFNDDRILFDVDDPEAYRRAVDSFGRGATPAYRPPTPPGPPGGPP